MDRAIVWGNMLNDVTKRSLAEREEIVKGYEDKPNYGPYNRIQKGVYHYTGPKADYYYAVVFPGNQKKLQIYKGPSLEDAVIARKEWEKENEEH